MSEHLPSRRLLTIAALAIVSLLMETAAPVAAQSHSPASGAVTLRLPGQMDVVQSEPAIRARALEAYTAPRKDIQETTAGTSYLPSQTLRGFLLAFPDETAGRPDRIISEAVGRMELKGGTALLTEAQKRELAVNLRTVLTTLPLPMPDVLDRRAGTMDSVDVTTTTAGKVRLVKVEGGVWRFSDDTIQSLPALIHYIETEQPTGSARITDTRGLIQMGARATMPEWAMTRWLGAALWQWAAFVTGIILGLPLIRRLGQQLLRGLILLAVARHGYKPSEDTMRPTTVAGSVIIMAYALYLGVNALSMPPAVTGFVTYTAILMAIYGFLGTMWFGLEALGRAYIRRRDMGVGGKTDEILINFIVRAAKILLILVGLTFIGSALGYNITAMLAGLGLGGVAIALAAKNTVENLLGTITILTDRPFRLGDRIKIAAVEGTIIKVGLRSTRIHTATESAVTLPNHLFINSIIENFGPLPRRVWRTTLALDPSNAPDQVMRFLNDVRTLIKNCSAVVPESIVVRANDFGPRSMTVLISVRIRALDDTGEYAVREEMILGINHLIASHNIKLAPPGT